MPEMRQQHDSARFSLCEAPQAALMRGFPGSSARTGLQRQAEIIRRPLTLQKLMLGLALRRPCPAARPKVRMPHCRNSLSAKEEDPLQGQLCVNRLLHSRCFPYRGLPGKNRPCRMFLRLCPMSPSGRGARKNSIFRGPCLLRADSGNKSCKEALPIHVRGMTQARRLLRRKTFLINSFAYQPLEGRKTETRLADYRRRGHNRRSGREQIVVRRLRRSGLLLFVREEISPDVLVRNRKTAWFPFVFDGKGRVQRFRGLGIKTHSHLASLALAPELQKKRPSGRMPSGG